MARVLTPEGKIARLAGLGSTRAGRRSIQRMGGVKQLVIMDPDARRLLLNLAAKARTAPPR